MKDIPIETGTCACCHQASRKITKKERLCIQCWIHDLAARLAVEKHEDDGERMLEAMVEDCIGTVD